MKVLQALGLTNRIASQIVVMLVLAGFAAWAAIASVLFTIAPEFELSPMATRHAATIITMLRGMEAIPAADRKRLISGYQANDLSVTLLDEKPNRFQNPISVPDRLRKWADGLLPPGVRVIGSYEDGSSHVTVIAVLTDGQLVAFRLARGPHLELAFPIVLMMTFFGAAMTLLLVWALRRLVTPLSRFAMAADRFGIEGHEADLKEEGPEEIKRAARAFNRMQHRIQRMIEDRTRMLMTISHDLRTPLTRLRLHVEEPDTEGSRRRMLDDIALMNASIESAISYVRGGGGSEAPEVTDLPSIIQTICSQFEDSGQTVTYVGPQHLEVSCLPGALERAITNLIDNAVKFGGAATVRLATPHGRDIAIDVEDDGPGIPDIEKARVVEPFYRADSTRHSIGGFGLGLSIAHTVARHHGGSLTLHDRLPRGLRARLSFPLREPISRPTRR